MLTNKRIILAITGGIAAYKSAFLLRELQRLGATVRVVMTEGAKEFITPLTLQALSGSPVHDNLFDPAAEAAMGHIELARWADAIVIAPASANTIAKLAAGRAEDLLGAICLATRSKIVFAPAMNQQMWQAPATQENLKNLLQRGFIQVGPGDGIQACGEEGPGRMEEPEAIAQRISVLFDSGVLAGKKVLITAGPTREALDPIRYLTNRSSGKMGVALAEAARDAGAEVVMICGPLEVELPDRVQAIAVVSAEQMLAAVQQNIAEQDIFIAAAAVCDYRPAQISPVKLKKSSGSLQVEWLENPDILAWVARQQPRPFCVGFAAETHDVLSYAKQKRLAKNVDMIVANNVSSTETGFSSDNNAVVLVTEQGEQTLALASKSQIARDIIVAIVKEVSRHEQTHSN